MDAQGASRRISASQSRDTGRQETHLSPSSIPALADRQKPQ